jgi:dUTP pyrophosphatase
MTTIKLKRIHPTANLPKYATVGSAAADVCAAIDSPVTIHPGETVQIPLGFALELPAGLAALLLPRSGLGAKQGVVLGNLVGLCDSDYRGQYIAALWLRQDGQAFTVNPGDRIAQLMIVPVVSDVVFSEVEELGTTERGEGGFGSTGAS